MSDLRVVFACGHEMALSVRASEPPVCPCGETQIIRTKARPPRFTGACQGPYAETQAVEPALVNLAPSGALRLKEPQE